MSVHIELGSLYDIDLLRNSQNVLLLSRWYLLNARVIPFDVLPGIRVMARTVGCTISPTVEGQLYLFHNCSLISVLSMNNCLQGQNLEIILFTLTLSLGYFITYIYMSPRSPRIIAVSRARCLRRATPGGVIKSISMIGSSSNNSSYGPPSAGGLRF